MAALTIPERALILAAALERPISPSQFAEKWKLNRGHTHRHFTRMEEDGFLRLYETAPGRSADGSNRGRNAHLYTAATSMLIRTEEWIHLPRSVREGHSFVVFVTLMSRISMALGSKSMDRDLGRHFSWKALRIDRNTWVDLKLRLDELLDWTIAAEKSAQKRSKASGEELIPATVALAEFRSPERADLTGPTGGLIAASASIPDAEAHLREVAGEMAPAVASLSLPVRALILAEALERPLSASEFAGEWGLDTESTARHFRQMTKAGLLEMAYKAPSRVAEDGSSRGRDVQRFVAKGSLLLRAKDWSRLCTAEREGHSMVVYLTLMSRITLALNARTMDRDLDRHFSWKGLMIDRQTWDELMARLDELLDWAIEAEKAAGERMRRSGEKPIYATVALGGFRSPLHSELLRREPAQKST